MVIQRIGDIGERFGEPITCVTGVTLTTQYPAVHERVELAAYRLFLHIRNPCTTICDGELGTEVLRVLCYDPHMSIRTGKDIPLGQPLDGLDIRIMDGLNFSVLFHV